MSKATPILLALILLVLTGIFVQSFSKEKDKNPAAEAKKGIPYEEFLEKKENPAHPQVLHAKVQEVLNGGGYAFLRLEGAQVEWAAVREHSFSVGDKVAYAEPLLMENFHSKSLDRTFEKIMFISKIRKMRVK